MVQTDVKFNNLLLIISYNPKCNFSTCNICIRGRSFIMSYRFGVWGKGGKSIQFLNNRILNIGFLCLFIGKGIHDFNRIIRLSRISEFSHRILTKLFS